MKCPHCNSHMEHTDASSDNKVQVSFYRCTICEAQHVTSSVVPVYQLNTLPSSTSSFSSNTSQNLYHSNI